MRSKKGLELFKGSFKTYTRYSEIYGKQQKIKILCVVKSRLETSIDQGFPKLGISET